MKNKNVCVVCVRAGWAVREKQRRKEKTHTEVMWIKSTRCFEFIKIYII